MSQTGDGAAADAGTTDPSTVPDRRAPNGRTQRVERQACGIADRASGTAERWYVVNTQPRSEARARVHLERQRYRVFLPCVRKTVRHARKVSHVATALFPNYLFVNLDIDQDPWRSVNSTLGVARMVMQGDKPHPVPLGIVEELQARYEANADPDASRPLEPGQTVQILDGPFANLLGKLDRLDTAGRVRVLLDLLGQSVPVMLRRDVLALPA